MFTDINSIFSAPENHGDGILFGNSVGWNGDKLELQRTQTTKKSSEKQVVERKKSVDMAIGILLKNSSVPEMLLVELRIGATPSKDGKRKRGRLIETRFLKSSIFIRINYVTHSGSQNITTDCQRRFLSGSEESCNRLE